MDNIVTPPLPITSPYTTYNTDIHTSHSSPTSIPPYPSLSHLDPSKPPARAHITSRVPHPPHPCVTEARRRRSCFGLPTHPSRHESTACTSQSTRSGRFDAWVGIIDARHGYGCRVVDFLCSRTGRWREETSKQALVGTLGTRQVSYPLSDPLCSLHDSTICSLILRTAVYLAASDVHPCLSPISHPHIPPTPVYPYHPFLFDPDPSPISPPNNSLPGCRTRNLISVLVPLPR